MDINTFLIGSFVLIGGKVLWNKNKVLALKEEDPVSIKKWEKYRVGKPGKIVSIRKAESSEMEKNIPHYIVENKSGSHMKIYGDFPESLIQLRN